MSDKDGDQFYIGVCTAAARVTEAEATAMLVINGKYGCGFSVRAEYSAMVGLPRLLESLAAQVREDLRRHYGEEFNEDEATVSFTVEASREDQFQEVDPCDRCAPDSEPIH